MRGTRVEPQPLLRFTLDLNAVPLVREDLASGRLIALPLRDAAHLTRELALVHHAAAEPLPPVSRALADAICAEAARLAAQR